MLELFDLSPKDRLIVQLLMSQGLLPYDGLRTAMDESKESFFFSLVEILVGRGLITLAALEDVLHDYCRKLRLGELALAKGLITEQQLDLALSLQEEREGRIGEIFVELHLATPRQIETLLGYQNRCRIEAVAS